MTFYYPIQDHAPLLTDVVLGGLEILHVFLAQMAAGGGMLLCYFEWLRRTARSPNAGRFINGHFPTFVMISFGLGALANLALWFTAIQVNPRTLGAAIVEFHWVGATAWTFFCVELVSGALYLRYKDWLSGQTRTFLLAIYSTAAWFSLFWMNGILSFPITSAPRDETHTTWSGFLDPSFWPSLCYRTVAAMAIAAFGAWMMINVSAALSRESRRELIGRAAAFVIPMVLMPLLAAWFLASVPPDSQSHALGERVPVTLFVAVGAGVSLLIGTYGVIINKYDNLSVNGFAAAVLCAIAFAATALGERVRAVIKQPYTIGGVAYARSLDPAEIERLRRDGSVTGDPYPLRDGLFHPNAQLRLGARVFRFQCRVCHTYDGVADLLGRAGAETVEQTSRAIARLHGGSKPLMPSFAGSAAELEALAQDLSWRRAGMPSSWAVSDDSATIAEIQAWLDESGPRRNVELMRPGTVPSGSSLERARRPEGPSREPR